MYLGELIFIYLFFFDMQINLIKVRMITLKKWDYKNFHISQRWIANSFRKGFKWCFENNKSLVWFCLEYRIFPLHSDEIKFIPHRRKKKKKIDSWNFHNDHMFCMPRTWCNLYSIILIFAYPKKKKISDFCACNMFKSFHVPGIF